ncbi:serine/threonine-protein kinase haspin [Lissotriton helveticus]
MASQAPRARGHTMRTYARRQPQSKIQLQTWLSPPIRQQHIFSSSSSSSSCFEQQDSTDPDFQPATKRLRKQSVAVPISANRSVAKSKVGRKALKLKKKIKYGFRPLTGAVKKESTISEQKMMSNKNMEDVFEEGKENSISGFKRSFINGTPQQKFITKRRKPALLADRGRPTPGERKQNFLTKVPLQTNCSVSPAQSPVLRRKPLTRRQRLNSPTSFSSTFSSRKRTSPKQRPIHKLPLLCSTPSVTLSIQKQMAAKPVDVSFDADTEVLDGEMHSFQRDADTSVPRASHSLQCLPDSPGGLRSRASSPNRVPSSIFSDSKSLLCISHCTPSKSCTPPPSQENAQGSPSIFCISSELFTPTPCSPNMCLRKPHPQVDRISLQAFQVDPSFQPVVTLNSDIVSRYFLISKAHLPLKEAKRSLILDSPILDIRYPGAEMTEKGARAGTRKSTLYSCKDVAITTSVTKEYTPTVNAATVKRSKISENNPCGTLPPESSACAVGTGRKVCISGFSSKRWGNRTRTAKTNKTDRQLSFRAQHSSASLLLEYGLEYWKHKPNEVVPSLGLGDSSEMLECMVPANMLDSCLNSSAILNLSSNSSFFRDNKKYARLRAALSLHKRKKVEVEAQSEDEGTKRDILIAPSTPFSHVKKLGILKTPAGQQLNWEHRPGQSSMSLLSPLANVSLCDVITDAEKVYEECMQDGPISFSCCIGSMKMQHCVKIGEGVFGEVFHTVSNGEQVALKIIPIQGDKKVNGEVQKSFGEILPEIIISKELSLLCEEGENVTEGFIKLHSVHCVKGSYPKHLLQAWDNYNQDKGSENERPDFFGDDQLFIILEFEFGGRDLENMKNELTSVHSAKSILHQLTAALAVAEEALCFEHRDLHWGNVLVKKTSVSTIKFKLNGSTLQIPTHKIEVNIIDYTLSRLEKDGLTVFCDISSDEELFHGEGDYQFDIYRSMKEENGNCWSGYHPHTNVLWLHYVADKLIKEMKYKKKPTTPLMKSTHKKLLHFHKEVLKFHSARDVLHMSGLFQ